MLSDIERQAVEAIARAIAPSCECGYTGAGLCVHQNRDYDLIAAKYLGAIETANNSTVAEIEEAAFRAELYATNSVLAMAQTPALLVRVAPEFSIAFWTAIAKEAIAKGEPCAVCGQNVPHMTRDEYEANGRNHSGTPDHIYVTDAIPSRFVDHARFDLNGREFIIPPLKLGKEQS